MRRFLVYSLGLGVLFWITSCSLLKVELASDSVPLPKSDLNIRVATQQYVSSAYADIFKTVDSIRSLTDDKQVVTNTLLWAINTETGLQSAVFQQSPRYALMDTWLFNRQLTNFMTSERTNELFAKQGALIFDECKRQERQVADIARRTLSNADYRKMEEFVTEQAQKYPFIDLSLTRGSSYTDWLDYNQIADTAMITTVGTLPEVVSDFSNRMSVMKNGLESTTQWRLEYMSKNSGITPEVLKASSDSIAVMTERLVRFAEQSPEMLQQAINLLNEKMTPLIDKMERRIAQTMRQFSQERDSVGLLVSRERQQIMLSLDSISVNVTRQAMSSVKGVIATAIGWLTLLLAVIIILPFVVGFVTARMIYVKKGGGKNNMPTEDSSPTASTKQSDLSSDI